MPPRAPPVRPALPWETKPPALQERSFRPTGPASERHTCPLSSTLPALPVTSGFLFKEWHAAWEPVRSKQASGHQSESFIKRRLVDSGEAAEGGVGRRRVASARAAAEGAGPWILYLTAAGPAWCLSLFRSSFLTGTKNSTATSQQNIYETYSI